LPTSYVELFELIKYCKVDTLSYLSSSNIIKLVRRAIWVHQILSTSYICRLSSTNIVNLTRQAIWVHQILSNILDLTCRPIWAPQIFKYWLYTSDYFILLDVLKQFHFICVAKFEFLNNCNPIWTAIKYLGTKNGFLFEEEEEKMIQIKIRNREIAFSLNRS